MQSVINVCLNKLNFSNLFFDDTYLRGKLKDLSKFV